MERTTYCAYEEDVRDYYPLDIMARIAELLEVNILELLDDYSAFLYRGQAGQIKALRMQMKLTQKALAARLGVQTTTVKRWEQDSRRITRNMWERVFLNR